MHNYARAVMGVRAISQTCGSGRMRPEPPKPNLVLDLVIRTTRYIYLGHTSYPSTGGAYRRRRTERYDYSCELVGPVVPLVSLGHCIIFLLIYDSKRVFKIVGLVLCMLLGGACVAHGSCSAACTPHAAACAGSALARASRLHAHT